MAANSGKFFDRRGSKKGFAAVWDGIVHTFTSPYFWIIFGVLVLSAAYGWLASTLKPEYALILASLPLLLVMFWGVQYRLYLAPIILMFVAAFTDLKINTGTESQIVDGLVLTSLFAAIWVVRSLIVHKKFKLFPYPVNKPLLGFIITVPISLVWSILFRDPFVDAWDTFLFVQLATALVMIMLPAAFLIVGNHVRDMRTLKIIVFLMVIASILGYFWDLEISPLKINTRGLFTMWVVCLTVGLAVFNRNMPVLIRGFLLFIALNWIYYRFGQNITWVSGWLPSFVVLFILLFMRSRKVAILLVVLMVVMVFASMEYYQQALEDEQDESAYTRLAAWSTNWSITKNHLLFGTGPGGYAAYLISYYPKRAMATHSNYVDIIAQLGVVGFIFYIWFFAKLVQMGYNLSVRLRGRYDFAEAMANVAFAGTVGCVVSMFFGDWLIPFPYTQSIVAFDYINYSWILMGSTLVLDRLTRTGELDQGSVQAAS